MSNYCELQKMKNDMSPNVEIQTGHIFVCSIHKIQNVATNDNLEYVLEIMEQSLQHQGAQNFSHGILDHKNEYERPKRC